MKFLNYFKTNLTIYVKQAPKLIFAYLAIPIIFSIFLSFTSGFSFSVEPKAPKIKVNIENRDDGQVGRLLDKYFEGLEASNIIVRTDKNDADHNIYIDENYGQSLLNKKNQSNIRIEVKAKSSISQTGYLKLMLEAINTKLQEGKLVEDLARDKKISESKLEAILENLFEAEADIAFKSNLVDGSMALSGRQYFSVVSMGYVLLMIFSSEIQVKAKPEFKGLTKRMNLLPFKHYQKILYSLVTDTLLYIFLLGIYILFWKLIDGTTFGGNLSLYFLILSVFAIFIVSLASLISLFLNESGAAMVSSLVTAIYVLFSGILSLDRISDNPIFVWLSSNPLKRLLIDPFFDILRGQGIGRLLPLYLSILGLALIINLVHLRVLGLREERA